MRAAKTYFAIEVRLVRNGRGLSRPLGGYVVDAFPDERAKVLAEGGSAVIGEYLSWDEAMSAVLENVRVRL